MVETDFTGMFLNANNAKENDFIEILNEGSEEERLSDKGQPYNIFNLPVRINGKDKLFSPSRETGLRFQKAWGTDSKAWVGKKATIKHVLKNTFGTTKAYIEAFPMEVKA